MDILLTVFLNVIHLLRWLKLSLKTVVLIWWTLLGSHHLVTLQDINHSLKILLFLLRRFIVAYTASSQYILFVVLRLFLRDDWGAGVLCDFFDVCQIIVKDQIDQLHTANVDKHIRFYKFEESAYFLKMHPELGREKWKDTFCYLLVWLVGDEQSEGNQLPKHPKEYLVYNRIVLNSLLKVGYLLTFKYIHEFLQELAILRVAKIFILQLSDSELCISS